MKNISEGTELGRKAKDFMDKGQLVPDELTIKLVEDRLEEEDTKTGYLLDGFPRTENQARVLGELLESKGEALDVALHIDVPETVIKSRMLGRRVCPSCGATYHTEFNPPSQEGICDKCQTNLIQRKDDLPEAVEARLKVYTISTRPLIEFYRRKGILKVVEGNKEIEEVSESITQSLQSRLQPR